MGSWGFFPFFQSVTMTSESPVPVPPGANSGGDSADRIGSEGAHEFIENLRPDGGGLFPSRVFEPAEHNAKTRRGIAVMILAVLGAIYITGAVAYIAHGITSEELVQFVAAFSGLQTLAAAAVGFYFAKEK